MFMRFFLLAILCVQSICFVEAGASTDEKNKLKVLHITFHPGCKNEFEGVAKALDIDLDTWIPSALPYKSFDGMTHGLPLYNIGHDRAERIWNLHKEEFNTYDAIVTSDTGPLARIFLQNGFEKHLIIWICNRFDYYDGSSLDCYFPDPEFYDLYRKAGLMKNVTVVAYTAFEHYYARTKSVDTGTLTITPCAANMNTNEVVSIIPPSIVKKDTFFLPPYHNETYFMNLSAHCSALGIPNYHGRYNGPMDLKDFKGIIHIPYSWSNLALFENISLGIPYFIPSRQFFRQLAGQGNFFHPSLAMLLNQNLFDLSEWYSPEHQELFTYFDSWEDLKIKIAQADYPALREKIIKYSQKHKSTMLERWKQVFEKINKTQ